MDIDSSGICMLNNNSFCIIPVLRVDAFIGRYLNLVIAVESDTCENSSCSITFLTISFKEQLMLRVLLCMIKLF